MSSNIPGKPVSKVKLMQRELAASPPDLLAVSRDGLIESHIIHDFKLGRVIANLQGCYGELMRERYRDLLSWLKGKRVIDCGCGFGQFSRVAIDAGFHVTPIDIDDNSLALARSISQIPCRKESVYATSLPEGSCDSAVCCDSIQHFDISHFAPEMKRLGVERIIIYDSNISNPLLAGYRAFAGHKESNDRTADEITREFREQGYDLVSMHFENIVALPVSGGFQRRPIPLLHRFPKAVRRLDRVLEQAARALRLDRRLAFRFRIVLDRRERPA